MCPFQVHYASTASMENVTIDFQIMYSMSSDNLCHRGSKKYLFFGVLSDAHKQNSKKIIPHRKNHFPKPRYKLLKCMFFKYFIIHILIHIKALNVDILKIFQ